MSLITVIANESPPPPSRAWTPPLLPTRCATEATRHRANEWRVISERRRTCAPKRRRLRRVSTGVVQYYSTVYMLVQTLLFLKYAECSIISCIVRIMNNGSIFTSLFTDLIRSARMSFCGEPYAGLFSRLNPLSLCLVCTLHMILFMIA